MHRVLFLRKFWNFFFTYRILLESGRDLVRARGHVCLVPLGNIVNRFLTSSPRFVLTFRFMRKRSLLVASLAVIMLGALPVGARAELAVPVRAATHGDFDRVVFDWPRDVPFHLHRDGETASITFDAAGEIALSSNALASLTRARGFAVHSDHAGHVTVSFALNPAASVKSFASGHSIVLDIRGKAAPEGGQTSPPSPPPVAAPAVSPSPVTAPSSPPVQAQAPVLPPKETPVAPPPVAAVKPPPPPQKAPPIVKPEEPVYALNDTSVLVATFDPHVPSRAVIYQRANVAYVVFERKLAFAPAVVQNGVALKITITPIELPKDTGYRFDVPPNAAVHATRDGTAWKIFLSKRRADIPVAAALIAQPDFALGARLLLPLPDGPDPIRMIDPVVGDELILVPLGQSEAFSVERHLAEFVIVPAAQGLVIKPLTDKLSVRGVLDGLEITAEGGLLLSRAIDTGASQQSSGKARAAALGKSIFDFATWKGKPDEAFVKTRSRLEQTIVDVPEIERNRARLELARFYFANGNGEEAIAMLNVLAEQVPDLRAHDDFLSLLGAAEILADHPEDGLRDLSGQTLVDQPEIELWQAVGLAQQRDWVHAEEKFALRNAQLTGYPDPFFSRFFVLAIEAALATGKDHEANDWLEFVTDSPHLQEIDPALTYLRGALHAKAGRAQEAQDAWKEVVTTRDRLYKVRAELALVDLGVSTASLTPAQAADRLEALRFGWRGDDLEIEILHRLGQFYIDAKNVKAGLNSMGQAVALYPDSPAAAKIHTEMEKVFHDVFLGELGKKLTPFDALTLYQQYRDLMPSGKDGDGVMLNLAEHLIDIDLLDQASSILEDLVKNRLKGDEKTRTAIRLAGIRLLDRKTTEAIEALDLVGAEPMSPSFQNERQLLRARAFSESNREAEAVALLKNNDSRGARMLRADIAMRAQDWAAAAKALMDLLGDPPPQGGKLTVEQSDWLVRAAMAYASADDKTGLDRLAIDYGDAMADAPQKETFHMLTQPEKTSQLRDLAAAQAQISQVDMFQNFLNTYRNAPAAAPEPTKKP